MSKGAWIDALEWTINQDIELKCKIIKEHLDDPTKHPWMDKMTDDEIVTFIFGDAQAFIDKWEKGY